MKDILALTCGIFQKEMMQLASRFPRMRFVFADSMLHMRPDLLQDRIDGVLAQHPSGKTLFIYGDCTPRIVELSRGSGFAKTKGINCCEILLGREEYRRLRKAGAFFFLPEWTLRWRDVFERELGFAGGRGAGEMLREVHNQFIYLDTGVMPVPAALLDEISRELEMPMTVLTVGLDRLEQNVANAQELLDAQ
ncbi:hypothetical protein H4684_000891 [Desulfomicrobium macestii]|uniref:DUF1638 domain-containing protein n=1 Tax=Desulfomicrobium macestii TaxID=90731 RepID=A0ABR9H0N6_9BACT|nr:DUF1638 domain-containing protein [Desulfomicrobium macestii]MBE1424264.1 hypothetical protein [Desulfomicrobium macestii]